MTPEDESSLDDNEIEGTQGCDMSDAQAAAPMQIPSALGAPP